MSLSGTNYVLNEHEYFDQYDPFALPSEMMPCYTYPTRLPNQNEIPVNMLTSWYGTNYVPNKHENVDQYDPYTIPSEMMPC